MKWALPTPRRCAGDLGTSRDFWQQLIRKISGNMFVYRKEYVCNEKGWFFYKKNVVYLLVRPGCTGNSHRKDGNSYSFRI